MTRDVAIRLVQAAEADSIIGSYLILSVMTGIRPEEARALFKHFRERTRKRTKGKKYLFTN